MSDIAGCCISEVGWNAVRTSLTPTAKFNIQSPEQMTPGLIDRTVIKIFDFIIYERRGIINIYTFYNFPGYEAAACHEFLIRGASLNIHQSIDITGVSHKLIIGADDPNKLFGVIILVLADMDDTVYVGVRDTLNALKPTH